MIQGLNSSIMKRDNMMLILILLMIMGPGVFAENNIMLMLQLCLVVWVFNM